jgi:hypothetical protein
MKTGAHFQATSKQEEKLMTNVVMLYPPKPKFQKTIAVAGDTVEGGI